MSMSFGGVPLSNWQGPVHCAHLAHLSQVDCQFGSRHKPLQNNNLQFQACFDQPTWLTLRTDTGPARSTRSQDTLTVSKRKPRVTIWRDAWEFTLPLWQLRLVSIRI
jgi:hypothetical protein